MASWPQLHTMADVDDAWSGLVPVVGQLELMSAQWSEAGSELKGTTRDLWDASGPGWLAHRAQVMLRMPVTAPAVLEPMDLEQMVTPDPVRAFWSNMRGAQVWRDRRKAGFPSARTQVRHLLQHVENTLFPQLVAYWVPTGESFDELVTRHMAWLVEREASQKNHKKAVPQSTVPAVLRI